MTIAFTPFLLRRAMASPARGRSLSWCFLGSRLTSSLMTPSLSRRTAWIFLCFLLCISVNFCVSFRRSGIPDEFFRHVAADVFSFGEEGRDDVLIQIRFPCGNAANKLFLAGID